MLRKVNPGRLIVLPALWPTSTQARGPRGTGLEILGQGLQEQFCGPAPQVVDHHVDTGGRFDSKGVADHIFRCPERDHRVWPTPARLSVLVDN